MVRKYQLLNIFVVVTFLVTLKSTNAAKPVVLWHGMGDTAHGSITPIKRYIERTLGVYVTSLRMGDSEEQDFLNSYFMDSSKQIETACAMIKNDTKLNEGFNLIGFSQGGQFVRALVQRCENISVDNLITLGAQHQGVYGIPRCPGENKTICNIVRRLLSYGAYNYFVQRHLVQAQYWHNPLQEETYVKKSLFLADVNNERQPRKDSYKQNLLKLKNFVLVKFRDDTIVDPVETELFGFYKPGQAKQILTLNETKLYTEDWLGLKELDESKRLTMYTIPGNHLQFTMEWFNSVIVQKYLK